MGPNTLVLLLKAFSQNLYLKLFKVLVLVLQSTCTLHGHMPVECKYFIFSNFYQIAHLGDDDGEPEFSSAIQLEEGETFFFAPRPLKNLVMVDELESLSPIMTAKVLFY